MKRKIKFLIIAVLLLLIIFRVFQRLSSKPPKTANESIPITIQTVGKTDLQELLSFSGTVEPNQKVAVLTRVSGKLESVLVQEGDRVGKGALLAKIEERDFNLLLLEAQSALKAAEAELENAESLYRRMSGLFAEEVITAQEMDNVKSRRDVARATVGRISAQVELARQQLADCRITAPFSGFVGRRFLDPGTFLNAASGPIMELVDLNSVKISVPVGESDLGRIKVSQLVKIMPDAFPEEVFSGKITRMNPVLDPVTRTSNCEIAISNPGSRLKAGMFARAEITVSIHKDAMAIPQQAVSRQGDKTYVFLINNNTAYQKEIAIGIQEGNLVEVKSGLQAGEEIATSGIDILFEGAKVEIVR